MRNYVGRACEIRDHFGRVHRGVIERVDPSRGIFMRRGFFLDFIPFFLIASLFFI
ncbi:ferredoxin-fold anticodon binding domain-containing protein [Neobacillus ginsengisoli]|uniref:Ferredoxin-fold anticodon binding domain-containing protein n=1 Tax=Neobacillus ginsengisoli TaxID=904295 RepID=A0ABT9Y248_9BACI|nr:ferredoxin-fold anticodon binding domain-containing protein [Neobacillus ginsengisoli]